MEVPSYEGTVNYCMHAYELALRRYESTCLQRIINKKSERNLRRILQTFVCSCASCQKQAFMQTIRRMHLRLQTFYLSLHLTTEKRKLVALQNSRFISVIFIQPFFSSQVSTLRFASSKNGSEAHSHGSFHNGVTRATFKKSSPSLTFFLLFFFSLLRTLSCRRSKSLATRSTTLSR